ncbi:MAG TPA: alpha/beta hydrolase fold domain-containing protein, partial [Stellaceae bacterium]|nr:alpha/beta hydrolase fold domain-containing protein [Stellaceae bacterium]
AATGLRLAHLALGGYGGDWRDNGQQIDSRSDGAEGRILDMARLYLSAADPCSPLAAPIYADLTGLAPLLIQVGAAETLLDDAIRLARVAGAADVRVDLQIWPEMIHVWHLFHPELKAGQRAIDEGGTFVRAHTTVKLA